MRVRLYDINVPLGYLCDASPAKAGLMESRPELSADLSTYEAAPWSVQYYAPKKWKDADRENNTDIKWRELVKENPAVLREYPFYKDLRIEVQDTDYLRYLEMDVDVSIQGRRTLDIMDSPAEAPQAIRMVEQMLALNDKVIAQLKTSSEELFNHPCQQVQPGAWVNNVNRMMLVEDSCTDAIQGYLDEGWRILAIQPQPDQRRPDYILGRFDPDHRPTGRGAERGWSN